MKKASILAILLMLWCTMFQTFAKSNYLHIIPRAEDDNEFNDRAAMIVELIGETWEWSVNDRYNEQAKDIADDWDLWMAFKTWVMNWDTLMAYVVYLMRFINQLGLLIWGIMILYAGYQFAWTIFKFWDATKGKSAIKNAIIWILVIVFSYAIWKWLESMFL